MICVMVVLKLLKDLGKNHSNLKTLNKLQYYYQTVMEMFLNGRVSVLRFKSINYRIAHAPSDPIT